jgi:putative hydrolase of the HAD superfamily
MLRAVRRCREHGFRTALLTNNIVAMDERAAGFGFDELFDVVIESSKVGVRKPDPAAYDLVLGALGARAEEVVFLDDLGVNLKPARAMGMATIKVGDPDDALSELESLLGVSVR